MRLVIASQTPSVSHPKEHMELQSSVEQMEAITVSEMSQVVIIFTPPETKLKITTDFLFNIEF